MSLLDENIVEQSDTNVYNYCWQHWHTTGYKNALQRTFHAVGHGAFYTERFYNSNRECVFTAVFDCGCYEAMKKGFSAKDYEERINTCIHTAFQKEDKIDLLFISHLHRDHINGVAELLNHCKVERIVLPALEQSVVIEAILYNYIKYQEFNDNTSLFIEELIRGQLDGIKLTEVETITNVNNIEIHSIDVNDVGKCLLHGMYISVENLHWRYYPINVKSKESTSVIEKLSKEGVDILDDNNQVDYTKIKDLVRNLGVEKCQKIYKDIFDSDHNSYSMVVFSIAERCNHRRCHRVCHNVKVCNLACFENCLYTGDFEANPNLPSPNKNYETLKSIYTKLGIDFRKIGIVQVPHHGSEKNMNSELYHSTKLCIISADSEDKYNHPNESVLHTIQCEQSVPIVITENKKTIQKFFLPY
jgi:hypothetical protein